MSVNGEWNNLVVGDCDLLPVFSKTDEYLSIKLNDKYYSAGKWILKIKRDKNFPAIQAHFKYEENGEKESKFICALIQYDSLGNEISGDYLNKKDGSLNIFLELNENTDYIVFEFMFYSFGKAELKIYDDDIKFLDKKPHRIINVATTCFKRKFSNNCNDNLEEILEILDNASKDKLKPDIILFTETVYDRGIVDCEDQKWIIEDSEPIKRVCEKAKETKMYVIFSFHEIEGKKKYNTDIIISPSGEIVGKYRKTHLTYKEIDRGMIPGDELKVFDLPFGKIGIIICWDQWFPDTARELVKKGAEIIFVSTGGNPECIYRSRAYENGVYCSLIYPIVIMCFENSVLISSPLTDEPFLELIISVILCGLGAGLVIYAGGSTGGIEIFALIVKEKTHFTVGNALMVFNLIIALFSSVLFSIKVCIFSVLGVLFHSVIVDKVIQILNSEKLLMIVTERGEKLCEYINKELAGSATVMNAIGSFEGGEKNFIIAVLKPQQASLLKKNIKIIDRNAFAVGMTTFDITGGWLAGKNKVV